MDDGTESLARKPESKPEFELSVSDTGKVVWCVGALIRFVRWLFGRSK
jgi:hypothetical protein